MVLGKIREQYYSLLREYFIHPNWNNLPDVPALALELIQAQIPPDEIAGLQEEVIGRLNEEFPDAEILPTIRTFSEPLMKLLISFGQAIVEERSDRKRAQETIKKSEALFRTTLYSIGDAIITTNKQGAVQQLNPVAERLTGWTEKEAAGMPLEQIFKIINEETRRKVEDPVRKVLRQGVVAGLANHTLLVARNGDEIPIADSGAPIKNDQGEITGVVLVFRDQTKERKAQRAVAEAREYAESIVATIREPLIVLDAKLRVLSANRSFYQTFKTDEKKTVGQYIYDLGDRRWDIPELRELLERILPQNTSFNDFEVETRFNSGGRRTMLLNARRLYHDPGKTRMILLAMEDITERKKAETELKKRNRELETFNEAAIGRELKIIELKKEVNNLLKTCKKKPKYRIPG